MYFFILLFPFFFSVFPLHQIVGNSKNAIQAMLKINLGYVLLYLPVGDQMEVLYENLTYRLLNPCWADCLMKPKFGTFIGNLNYFTGTGEVLN